MTISDLTLPESLPLASDAPDQPQLTTLPQPRPLKLLPPSSPLEEPSSTSLADYAEKDKAWVRQALAASAGALMASKRRLRLYLRSLPPDSPEAQAISSFLSFGA